MTVKQIKEELSKFPDDMEVLFFNRESKMDFFNDHPQLRTYRATKVEIGKGAVGYVYRDPKAGEKTQEVVVFW